MTYLEKLLEKLFTRQIQKVNQNGFAAKPWILWKR